MTFGHGWVGVGTPVVSQAPAKSLDIEQVMRRVVHGMARDPMRIHRFAADRDL